MTTPPPIPLPLPGVPQPVQGQRGYGPQGPPPGLSPDPAVANKGANIAKGLSLFMESYLGAKNAQHQMYTQKVQDVMDSLASGRTTLDMIDQDKVAQWIKKSGLPIRTEAFTPEETAYKQQAAQQQQAQQAYMQQMSQNASSLPQQVGGQLQGLPPQLAGALAPGISQTLSQAQPQPQAPAPLGAPPQAPAPQAGLGAMLQRLINPGYGASANSPAGELMQRAAMSGALGPQSPEQMYQHGALQLLGGSLQGQQMLTSLAANQPLRAALDKYGPTLADPHNTGYMDAIMALGRFRGPNGEPIIGTTELDPYLTMVMHQHMYDNDGHLDPMSAVGQAWQMKRSMEIYPKMAEEAWKNALDSEKNGQGDANDIYEYNMTSGARGTRPTPSMEMMGNFGKMYDIAKQALPGMPPWLQTKTAWDLTDPKTVPEAIKTMQSVKYAQSGIDNIYKSAQIGIQSRGVGAEELNAQVNNRRQQVEDRESVAKNLNMAIEAQQAKIDQATKAGDYTLAAQMQDDMNGIKASARNAMSAYGMSNATNPYLNTVTQGSGPLISPIRQFPHGRLAGAQLPGAGGQDFQRHGPEESKLEQLINKSAAGMPGANVKYNESGSANR